jgi:hypothetical protein
MEIEPHTGSAGSVYFSIVNDNVKNSISNTGSYPYHCLFSSSSSRFTTTRGTNFNSMLSTGV